MRVVSALFLLAAWLHASAADSLDLKVNLYTVSGQPLDVSANPSVDVIRFDGKRLAINGAPVRLSPNSATFTVHLRRANPGDEDAVDVSKMYWRLEISDPAYAPAYIGPLHIKETAREVVPADGGVFEAMMVRDPDRWRPKFECSKDLFARDGFKDLGLLLANGPVYLRDTHFLGAGWKKFESLAGTDFSDPPGVEHDDALDRARAAALNLYHAIAVDRENSCTGGPSENWFQQITAIHVLNEERIIALAKPELFEHVLNVSKQFPAFACNLSYSAPSELHHFEDPRSAYWTGSGMPHAVEVISIKTPMCQGNVQITVGRFRAKGKSEEVLADFDIDEHLAFVLHSSDVLRHMASGRGTNAYEMGEMLTVLDRNRQIQAGQTPTSPVLGYSLVPRAEKRSSSCEDSTRRQLKPK